MYDLGGSTLNVSILEVENGLVDKFATADDTYLGGEDFNQRIVDYFVRAFKNKYSVDIKNDSRAL